MRPTEDMLAVGGAFIVAIAAVLGGAFFPGPRLVIGVLLALLLGCIGLSGRTTPSVSEEWLFLAVIGWGAVSAVVVGMAPLAAREVLTGWLVAWCLWIIARRTGPPTSAIGAAVLVAAALLVAVGIGLESTGRAGLRVGGLFESPNIAASLLVAALPLVGLSWSGSRRRWMIPIVIILVGGVILTGSRAGMLAVLAAGVVLVPRGRPRILGLLAGGIGIAAVLAWRFASHPEVLAWFRPSIWLAVLRLWASHPLAGVGPGGLADAAGPVRLLHSDHVGHHQFLMTYAESSPLGLLVQTGAVGLVVFVVAASLWLRRARENGALAYAPFQSALMGMTVMAAFHDFVNIDIVVWWWVLVLGLIEADRRTGLPASHVAQERVLARAVSGLALAVIIMWGMVQPSFAKWLWRAQPKDAALVDRVVAAESWFDEPLEVQLRSLLDEATWTWQTAAEALALGREAVRIHPGASRLWMILGQVHYRTINELGAWPDSISGARAAFERASQLEPHQPWPWLEWARLERGLGDLDESAALTLRALASEPHAVRARLFLARIELDRGNRLLASEALERARESRALRRQPGLRPYEKELLAGPAWQFRELEEALQ